MDNQAKRRNNFRLMRDVKLLLIFCVSLLDHVFCSECLEHYRLTATVVRVPDREYFYTIGDPTVSIDFNGVFDVRPEYAENCWIQQFSLIDPLPEEDSEAIRFEDGMLAINSALTSSAGTYRARLDAVHRVK